VFRQFKVIQGTFRPKKTPSAPCFHRPHTVTSVQAFAIYQKKEEEMDVWSRGKTAFRAFKKVWFVQSTPFSSLTSHPCYHTSACTSLWDAGLTSASVSSAHSLPLLLNDCSNWFRRAERASANWSVQQLLRFWSLLKSSTSSRHT